MLKTKEHVGRLIRNLFAVTMIVLLLPAVAISIYAFNAFEGELQPEMSRKALAVGRSVQSQIDRALGYGIPLRELRGLDTYLGGILGNNRDLGYIAVVAPDGKVLDMSGTTPDKLPGGRLEALDASHPVQGYYVTRVAIVGGASVLVGIDERYVQGRLREVLFDVLIVLLVSLLVSFELLMFLVIITVSSPLKLLERMMGRVATGDFSRVAATRSSDEIGRFVGLFNVAIDGVNQRYQQLMARVEQVRMGGNGALLANAEGILNRVTGGLAFTAPSSKPKQESENSFSDVRTPLFLFVFAEEMSRSFMPLVSSELYQPSEFLSRAIAIGLPISVYMFICAIASPWSGSLADRLGAKRCFYIGIVPSLLGFVATALADGYWQFVAGRGLSALGYAICTIACQSYIISISTPETRGRGMSVFVSAIMAASICGTAVGSVIADQIGYQMTFLVSAILGGASLALIWSMMPDRIEGAAPPVRQSLKLRHFKTALSNPRFSALLAFCAIPNKLVLTGFLYYAVPLYLKQIDLSQPAIGRTMMTYGIVMVLAGPAVGELVDRTGGHARMCVLGGLLTTLAVVPILLFGGSWMILLGVISLGLAHAMSSSPMLAMVPTVCQREAKEIGLTFVFSIVRLLERVGSVAGPFVAAYLASAYGYPVAIAGLGAIAGLCAVLMWIFFRAPAQERAAS